MRCPDCNKFTSLESQDPEVNSIEARLNESIIEITADVHHARNCADCGQELKALDIQPEINIQLSELTGWDKLSKEDQQRIKSAAKSGSGIELEVDTDDSSYDESGGSRYAKNLITVSVDATLKIIVAKGKLQAIIIQHKFSLIEEHSAGEYEEQV